MIKPASIRAALAAACPHLAQNPETLHVFVEEGNVRSTMAGGFSCEYSYTLTLLITDYADSPDLLMIPLMAWLRRNQPDLLENFDRQRDHFSFQVDYLDHEKCDVEIKLREITERVVVRLHGLVDGTPTHPDASIPIPEGMVGPAAIADIIHIHEPLTDLYEHVTRWRFWVEDVPESRREWDVNPLPGQQHLRKG